MKILGGKMKNNIIKKTIFIMFVITSSFLTACTAKTDYDFEVLTRF